jgi:hypothetical protein
LVWAYVYLAVGKFYKLPNPWTEIS